MGKLVIHKSRFAWFPLALIYAKSTLCGEWLGNWWGKRSALLWKNVTCKSCIRIGNKQPPDPQSS